MEEKAMEKPNVLFIPIDDLRPQLNCYGQTQMVSPHMDELAGEGVIFQNAYCQVPVCGATRACLLTGVRPNRERFVTYHAWADKDLPGALTLPEHFRKHGYTTISNGKVFHHRTDTADRSWSEVPWHPGTRGNWRNYLLQENQAIAATNDGRGPAFECADVPDNAYIDGQIADRAIQDLHRLKDAGEPFFLAVGFLKPHLPFNAPKRYWDLYKRAKIDLADNPFRPRGAPDAAMHNWGELRAYFNIPAKGSLPDEMARTLIHGYYAATSFTDAQVGRLLHELDRLGLRENTVVVLWGDHGWQLGEHGLWCKHCNFNTSLNAPLIVSAPDFKGEMMSNALVEFVDVYPTLCELAGLPLPDHLEGTSFVPLLEHPNRQWKKAAFSRYFAGDSIRTDQYLYTEWTNNEGDVTARMLYDHKIDPKENENISEKSENQELVAQLSKTLRDGWQGVLPDIPFTL
jgi:iduronate 2-sulfatase